MRKFLITLILIVSAAGYSYAAEISTEAKLQYNQGVDYSKLGQYDKAITSFRQAIALEPDYIDAYYNLGSILEYMKQDEAALTVFKQIIVRKPTDYESVYKAAYLSVKIGESARAKQYLSIIPPTSMVYNKAQVLAKSLDDGSQTAEENTSQQVSEASSPPEQEPNGIIPQSNGVYENLGSPTGVVADDSGNLYIAAFSDNAIYKITPDGKRTVYVKDEKIKGPIGLAIDSQKNIYVANYNADNIVKISNKSVVSVFISNVKKPYCLYVKDNMLLISSQGTNSVMRFSLQ